MRFGEETPTIILSNALRALEAEGREITVESLLDATRRKGIMRREAVEFMEKTERGKQRRGYPGYFKEDA